MDTKQRALELAVQANPGAHWDQIIAAAKAFEAYLAGRSGE